MSSISRFRITQERDIIFRCHTMNEIYDWLQNKADMYKQYWVEDIIDDIEVDADEVMSAYREGEIYGDLQGF